MSLMPLNPLLERARARERSLAEAESGYHMLDRRTAGERAVGHDARSHFKTGHAKAIGVSLRDDKGIKGVVPTVVGRTRVIGHFKSHVEAHRAIVSYHKRGTLAEAASESDKPPSVHASTVFDDKNPADSYPSGTEINFGETAPMDMSGIPDLFDPAAATGDGI